MVIEWTTDDDSQLGNPPKKRAAEYVRMSTEHQKYSTDNQAAEIRAYAARRGFEIVRTYADEGKSGLSVDGRASLQRLLADIDSDNIDFEALLVYDVSRLGRWQDTDEAAYHELRCKRAGITVHYCAEQFENDGTIGSSIIKTVKRAMAGEYKRHHLLHFINGFGSRIGAAVMSRAFGSAAARTIFRVARCATPWRRKRVRAALGTRLVTGKSGGISPSSATCFM